jgi:halimadienyl-diphosphate synthase
MTNLIYELLDGLDQGKMSSLAYDTAWVARLGEIDRELSNHALNWIAENQLSDGSWGVEYPYYYHDRVISTLAAMIALTERGRRHRDQSQIERGLTALEVVTSGATQGLSLDPNGATVGFEMVAPILVSEAEQLGIIRQQGERVLGKLRRQRAAKLALIRGKMINRYLTMAFSAEMAGLDGLHKLDIEQLQEENGSVGNSPSATAYFALHGKPGDKAALNYLHQVVRKDGGAPDLAPFEIYEKAWILWNLSLVPNWDEETLGHFKPHLDYLFQHWKNGIGVGFSNSYSVPDGDDTIITYDILSKYGYPVDLDAVLSFEEKDHFRCYDFEVGVSPSVNIHALNTLRAAGFSTSHPTVQKIFTFLKRNYENCEYWIDKWHSSPFYSAAHFVIACTGFKDELVKPYVTWILSKQQNDGSWGGLRPTAEETAYCLQALGTWNLHNGKVSKDVFRKGLRYLEMNLGTHNLPLWIGKGLYTVDNVVRSSILSAMALARLNM